MLAACYYMCVDASRIDDLLDTLTNTEDTPMARTNKTADASPLATLRAAIWQHVTITDQAVAALRAAGEETDAIKSLVLSTYMARRMNPGATECTDAMIKKALAVLALPGASSKGEGKKRTVEQERFYTGARQYMFALRKKADVVAGDNRGGANNPGTRAPRPSSNATDDQDIPIAPKAQYDTEPKVRAHMMHLYATALAFAEARQKDGVCGDATIKVARAVMKLVAPWATSKPE